MGKKTPTFIGFMFGVDSSTSYTEIFNCFNSVIGVAYATLTADSIG